MRFSRVQNHSLPEGDLHPQYNPQDHWTVLAKYRAAIMRQLLTPAPTVAKVAWKRAAFKAGDHRYTDVSRRGSNARLPTTLNF
jgi:hypothetical protein